MTAGRPPKAESPWQSIDSAPQEAVVETKIHDENGPRNVQRLIRIGRLWYFGDQSMYVYYVPTHWRPLS